MARSFVNLPGYDIVKRIGKGAGAVIYHARQRSTRKDFAVKHVVRHSAEDERFVEQAENEAAVASGLDHAFLRRCIGIERVRRWLKIHEVFLVMELVDAPRLEDERPQSLDEIVRIYRQVAEGLDGLHRTGFAHADIKPNNIMILPNAVKIIDFGQSCRLGHRKVRVQGTPDFIAPEQVQRNPIDQRTDVFNLGATMYWVATGKWFRTLMNTGMTASKMIDVNARSGNEEPHVIRKQIPLPLSKLIMDCCEPRPIDRPRDMKQVISRLDTVAHLIERKRQATAAR